MITIYRTYMYYRPGDDYFMAERFHKDQQSAFARWEKEGAKPNDEWHYFLGYWTARWGQHKIVVEKIDITD